MKSKKDRRESGRVHNKEYNPSEGLYIETYWDDWMERRDGYRDCGNDRTKLVPKALNKGHWGNINIQHNKKIKKLLKRRIFKKHRRCIR